ncbi:hypothetical protein [Citricoccus nitrophenolicus]|uniref:hypothetical protein n=1 Tax=Citricoccus nitrophenolicus TaxID=863575 RepID=UPI0031E88266
MMHTTKPAKTITPSPEQRERMLADVITSAYDESTPSHVLDRLAFGAFKADGRLQAGIASNPNSSSQTVIEVLNSPRASAVAMASAASHSSDPVVLDYLREVAGETDAVRSAFILGNLALNPSLDTEILRELVASDDNATSRQASAALCLRTMFARKAVDA